jgi:aryl-alcohol dehydrogenase-like predicted oxidoreductase
MIAKRAFGKTGLKVSVLTFGGWSIGGPAEMGGKQIGWSGVNDAESLDALAAAYDAGINFFDTANAYGRGHSEELLAQAFKGKRDKVIISSKYGMIDDPAGFKLDFSRKQAFEACEASLKRLQTDYLDVYLMHMIVDGYPLQEETRAALEELKKQGKIRHYGVSVQFPFQGFEQLDKKFGDSMMIEYSPLKRDGVVAVLDRAHQAGVGVITRGALEKGLLLGKYQVGHKFDFRDVRSRIPQTYIDRLLGNVNQLKSKAAAQGWSLLGMALHYHLAQRGCSTITVGMKTRKQVEENVAAVKEKYKYNWKEMIAALEAPVVAAVAATPVPVPVA